MTLGSSPVWHPFTQMKNAGPFPVVSSARGSRLQMMDGAELIDAISSWWTITHGHCEPTITKAIAEQSARLDQVIFAGFTHPKAEELAQRLVDLTPPSLSRVFFSDDGSTAVEVALKMTIQACRQNGNPERDLFIAFEHAYHGDTLGAMSVGGESVFTAPFRDMMFRVARATHPTYSTDTVEAYVKDFESLLDQHQGRIAGVILEPLVQGAGGMIVWPLTAVQSIARMCRERGIFLIYDEVMTGFGRTGSLFAMQQVGIAPDLVCFSKGLTGGTLPLSVTMATDELYAAFLSDDRSKTFFHGHSFTANPITCSAAVANLDLLKQKDMNATWQRINAVHKQRILRYASHADDYDSRVLGTIAAVELKRFGGNNYLASAGPDMYQHALSRGVLLRPLGNVLYMMPPYCITDDELNFCWDIFDECTALAESRLS